MNSSSIHSISINDAVLRSVIEPRPTPSQRWPYIACMIVGLAALCLTIPNVTNVLSGYVPQLTHVIGTPLYTTVVSSGPFIIGAIDLIKNRSEKKKWELEDNLLKLYQRKRGEKLIVNGNEIKTMHTGQRVLYALVPWYRRKQMKLLEQSINGITSQIRLADQSTEIEKCFVKKLFFESLPSLSRKIYKRNVDSSVLDYLGDQIEDEDSLAPDATEKFVETFKSATIWARLGNFKRPKGGVGGSYAIIDGTSQQALGIYKPSDEDTLEKNNPYLCQKIKYFLYKTILRPITGIAFQTVGGQGYFAETVAKRVERCVVESCLAYEKKESFMTEEFELIPETQIVTLELAQKAKRIGSFQLWVDDPHQTASQFFQTSRNYRGVTKENMENQLSSELFDLMVIIDYITGNFDRHGDNWFIMDEGNDIRLIDGGWAMAPRHPKGWNVLELRNHYLWKKLPMAESGFTELGRFVIKRIAENTDSLMANVKSVYGEQLSDAQNRINTMKERIQVLQKVDSTITKKELANIRTLSSIQKVLAT
jgi:hypothetical protein